ncbi:MAG: HlyD family efflux transporter periplasmic adaptor subunit [Deltaproteobacteria bacterium]|nr:HlyD family efflux transporter periplasmic adaptor subunit [Deltaproteobacteria bacterium]
MKKGLFLVALITALLAVTGYTVWKSMWEPGEFLISGIIEADDIHVGSKIGGRVLKVVAKEGQKVGAGEVLVLLEPEELKASLLEAQSGLRQAEAKLAELTAGYRREEIEQAEAAVKQQQEVLRELVAGPRPQEVDQARADWLAAKAQYENAEKFRQRMKELTERQLVAQQEYDDASTKADEAAQKTKAARERYDLLLAGTRQEQIAQARHRLAEAEAKLKQLRSGFRREEIAQARAGVEMARARVQLLKTQLDETVIKSPVDAVVDVLDLEPGDLVGAGKPVATLLRTTSLWVRAYLPEDKLGYVRPGLKVKIRVDSFPGKAFSGVVRRVHRQAEFTPRNVQTWEERVLQVFQTEVVLEDAAGELRPGMNADVVVPTARG